MSSKVERLQGIYTQLGRVLQSPQSFGLGPDVPQPLAMCLEATLKGLGGIIDIERISAQSATVLLSRDVDREALNVFRDVYAVEASA